MNSLWKTEYEVGIPEIDSQHRQLADSLQLLMEAQSQRKDRAETASLTHDLIQATLWHFRDEEMLLARHDCPGLQAHRLEHLDLTERAMAFQKAYDAGTMDLSPAVVRYFQRWLFDHITSTDLKAAQFVKARPS